MGRKISILMGIYNCAPTLRETIDSIIAQTYDNWELIMCDDGSVDNTLAIAEQYRRTDPERFILLKNETNMGLNDSGPIYLALPSKRPPCAKSPARLFCVLA